jgi:alkylated DNA repair dioxygenase AlkB
MSQTLCLFDETAEAGTLYQPSADRLTMVHGDIAEVAGLSYEPEFITAGEERVLLWHADRGAWSDFWTRRTQFYGIRYERSALQIDPSAEAREPVPAWCDAMRRRLVERGLMDRMANQIGINEYLPGQGIAGHVDYFRGMVVSLTLGSGCVMDITEPLTKRIVSLWLAPRSILVLQSEARNVWEHGIARRQKDIVNGHPIRRGRRVSITFRDVLTGV